MCDVFPFFLLLREIGQSSALWFLLSEWDVTDACVCVCAWLPVGEYEAAGHVEEREFLWQKCGFEREAREWVFLLNPAGANISLHVNLPRRCRFGSHQIFFAFYFQYIILPFLSGQLPYWITCMPFPLFSYLLSFFKFSSFFQRS